MWRKIGLVLVGMFGALVLSAQVAGPPGLVGIVAGGLSQAAADALYVALAGGIMTGQLVNRLDPAGTALTDSSVLVNPAACGANEPLLGTGVAGVAGMTVDCEGDVSTVGEIQVSKNSNARNSVYVNNQNAGNAAGAELDADALGASMRSGALGTGNSGIAGTSIVGGDVYLIGNGSPLKLESTNGAITMATANTARLTIALGGGVTLSGALDAKGTISNSGASNSGRVYVDDALGLTDNIYITTSNAGGAFTEMQSSNASLAAGLNLRNNSGTLKAQFAYGNASNGAPYGGNAYIYTVSGTGFNKVIGDVHITAETSTLIQNKVAVQMDAAVNKGSKTLAAGTGTVTVTSGALCTCTDQTSAAAVKCDVSSTTLTITGTGTDVITYHCF